MKTLKLLQEMIAETYWSSNPDCGGDYSPECRDCHSASFCEMNEQLTEIINNQAKEGDEVKEHWKFIGKLLSGKYVYQRGKELAVEQDHRYLVAPTSEERGQIYRELRR